MSYRRLIQKYLVMLKEDQKLSETCRYIRESLQDTINSELFSDELKNSLTGQNKVPFKVSDDDPPQISVLKKILNALHHAEYTFEKLELIDFSEERYLAGIIGSAVKVVYKTIDELYAAINLINQSSEDIQAILGPAFKTLLPKLEVASLGLMDFTVEGSKKLSFENTGNVVANATNLLPSNLFSGEEKITSGLSQINDFIFQIPQYLESLKKMISTGESITNFESKTSTEEYQNKISKLKEKAQNKFENLLKKNNFFTMLPNTISILRLIGSTSSDLMNTAAPLTKQAYHEATKKLNEIRQVFPPLACNAIN